MSVRPTANRSQSPVAVLGPKDPKDQAALLLEHGSVLLLPELVFDTAGYEAVMFADVSDEGAKNVSYNPATGELKGTTAQGAEREQLTQIVARYAAWAESLVRELLPAYAASLQVGRTSYRPRGADHNLSKRKDDRRLHLDAFPANPVQGRRILRVFHNVNPNGESRFWRVGEPMADHAARFLGKTRPMAPGAGLLMQGLGLTKGRRTPYDHLMLQLHDLSKEDDAYQAEAPHQDVSFPPGSTWLVFTDGVVHAALGGRYAFEQTFYVPVSAMVDPPASPLKTLERLTGKALV
jgi:hypothetical protein